MRFSVFIWQLEYKHNLRKQLQIVAHFADRLSAFHCMMELMYANRIRSLRNTLVETIKPEDVAHKLWGLRCISKKEKDKLVQVRGQHSHNSMLIDLLLSKSPSQCVLEKFVGVLEDTANVGVAHLIQHEISDKGKN